MEIAVDGRAVFCATGGRPIGRGDGGDREMLVFLHGAGLDSTVWTLPARYFAHHGYDVLAPDLPGHGRSTGPPLATIAALGEFVGALLQSVAAPRATLIGHSMGALVALATAAAQPPAALALLAPAAPMAVSAALMGAAQAHARDAIDMILAFGFSPAAQRGGHPAPGLWLTGSAARLLERTLDGTLAVDLAACNAYRTATADAARVRCPALVLLAETDRLTPPAAAEPLIAALPGNAVVRLPRVGHFMVEEAPDAVIDALRAFLAGAVPAGR